MPDLDKTFYCSVWDDEAEEFIDGEHGTVDTVVLTDAYFHAGQISDFLPNNQYIGERDLEMVSFRIDVSGDTLTEEDVSSPDSDYLEKFTDQLYSAVAQYVSNLEYVEEGFQCGNSQCSNVASIREDQNSSESTDAEGGVELDVKSPSDDSFL